MASQPLKKPECRDESARLASQPHRWPRSGAHRPRFRLRGVGFPQASWLSSGLSRGTLSVLSITIIGRNCSLSLPSIRVFW